MATLSTGTIAPITLLKDSADTDGSQDTAVLYPKNTAARVLGVAGTFDGATIALVVNVDDEWVSAGDLSEFTEAGAVLLAVPRKMEVRGHITGSGGSTSLTMTV